MTQAVDTKDLRNFGLLVGGLFLLIGAWPMIIHQASPRWWAIGLGAVLGVLGAVSPRLLGRPYRGWMFIGHILGTINTRILLAVIFYGLVTPMGAVRRLFNKNPMGRAVDPTLDTYRVFQQPRPRTHLKQQF